MQNISSKVQVFLQKMHWFVPWHALVCATTSHARAKLIFARATLANCASKFITWHLECVPCFISHPLPIFYFLWIFLFFQLKKLKKKIFFFKKRKTWQARRYDFSKHVCKISRPNSKYCFKKCLGVCHGQPWAAMTCLGVFHMLLMACLGVCHDKSCVCQIYFCPCKPPKLCF